MEYQSLAMELCDMQLMFARQMRWTAGNMPVMGEQGVLIYLYCRRDGVSPGELAMQLQLTSGRMANILKLLEQKGYIARRPSPKDRRKVLVLLTGEGRLHIAGIYQQALGRYVKRLQLMGEDDATDLVRLLKRFFALTQGCPMGENLPGGRKTVLLDEDEENV